MIRLVADAVRRHGAPRWIITDQGTQFTAVAFGRAMRRRGIRRRFGAVGKKGSIALIERWCRAMKEEYGTGLLLFRPLARIERDPLRYVRWHNAERPHQGLGQRTPDEVYFGRPLRPPTAGVPRGVLEVTYLESDRQLPVLRLRRAA